MKYSFKIIVVVFLAAFFIIGFIAVDSTKAKEKEKCCFYNSLHCKGEGMRYWYEEQGGFKAVTGIPYEHLDCKNCHVKSCDQCHVEKKGGKCLYSLKKAKDSKTCLVCHGREGATFKIGKAKTPWMSILPMAWGVWIVTKVMMFTAMVHLIAPCGM